VAKFTILLKRKPMLSHDEFVEYHKMNHAQLFMSITVVEDTVRRYVQQHALPVELPVLPLVKYDGVTELVRRRRCARPLLRRCRIYGEAQAGQGEVSRPPRLRFHRLGRDGRRRLAGW
jgi:hypothetical protein